MDIAMNRLDGAIPDDLFEAPKLETLHLYANALTGPVPESAGVENDEAAGTGVERAAGRLRPVPAEARAAGRPAQDLVAVEQRFSFSLFIY
jgi:hypothetical protein